ncbi:negative regulator of sigma-B (phosphoserine phosphatase) [Salirhabdus euzebyi]|uniref:Negative regulator of sigma-B (Phosphoserine phosphatase) n=1 Tax=Salirhabdus euzebyi TaxID=394506 RepID=A0A841Q714_9BACI|nr:PP2C family serine/threonine-protein phosphatase [Salirhabdus euzebyi]MBB6454196.1 negative regulator of sigma-B (phosphoserine phosphatase) [Salirhabdus euzebyi]
MKEAKNKIQISVYQKAKTGNDCSGDSFFYKETEDEFICVIADGLGSGQPAKESSQAVVTTLEKHFNKTIDSIIKNCNDNLYNKRGAVLGILKMDLLNGTYKITSIGNIGIIMLHQNGEKKRYIPTAGYLCGTPARYKVFEGRLEPGQTFFMYSDGVEEKFLLKNCIQLSQCEEVTKHYSEINVEGKNDDTTLIAMKYVH